MSEREHRTRGRRWTTWALVAIAIALVVGLMAATALTTVLIMKYRETQREEQRRAEALENLKAITNAVLEYQAPNGEFFPSFDSGFETHIGKDDPTAEADAPSDLGDQADIP